MKHTFAAVTLSLLAVVLIGCGSASSPSGGSGTSVISTDESSYSIDSWRNWGRAGVEWLSECDEYAWGCVNDQAGDLLTAASTLPTDDTGAGALLPVYAYQNTYREYVAEGCESGSTTSLNCSVKLQQLSVGRKNITNAALELSGS
ncbi:hypothetical protein NWF34_10135 [Gordonia sp. GONU]|nr:hypothetical protein [Gordonia sp. GONU]MCR8897307.1 hypothetical protein [Gordonia sp. GONU]